MEVVKNYFYLLLILTLPISSCTKSNEHIVQVSLNDIRKDLMHHVRFPKGFSDGNLGSEADLFLRLEVNNYKVVNSKTYYGNDVEEKFAAQIDAYTLENIQGKELNVKDVLILIPIFFRLSEYQVDVSEAQRNEWKEKYKADKLVDHMVLTPLPSID